MGDKKWAMGIWIRNGWKQLQVIKLTRSKVIKKVENKKGQEEMQIYKVREL